MPNLNLRQGNVLRKQGAGRKKVRTAVTKARALIAIFGQQYSNASLQELAILFNRDASTISHSIYNYPIRCQHNEKDSEMLSEIQAKIKKVAKLQA